MRTVEDFKKMGNYQKLVTTLKNLGVHGSLYLCNTYMHNPRSKPYVVIIAPNADVVDEALEMAIPALENEDADYYGPSEFGIFVVVFDTYEGMGGFTLLEEV